MPPSYDFLQFREACKDRNRLFVWEPALVGAEQFNLKSESQLLDFINKGGLEDLQFVNTTPWKKQPKIMVDAYEFRTAYMRGYIAFFHNDKTAKWNIKSFKLSRNMNTLLGDALTKAIQQSEILQIDNKIVGDKDDE